MAITDLIILVGNKFTNRDYYRFNIDKLIEERDISVTIIDISICLKSNIDQSFYHNFDSIFLSPRFNIKIPKSFIDFKTTLLLHENTNILSMLECDFKTFKFYKFIFQNNFPTSVFSVGTSGNMPDFDYNKINTNSKIKKLFNSSIRRVLGFTKRFYFKLYINIYSINKLNFYFLFGGKRAKSNFILIGKKTKIVKVNSLNYSNYLSLKESENDFKRKEYFVFLDQNIVKSSDSSFRNESFEYNVNSYYRKLNELFKSIESHFNLEIIISLHPKANDENFTLFFQKYKILKLPSSIELIKHSKGVVTSYSTAIDFAILYDKPIIMFTNNEINLYKYPIIDALSKYLNISVVNIDNKYNLSKEKVVNKVNYNKYKSDFLINESDKSLTFFKIYDTISNTIN
jgi:hypothetical protein